MHKHSESGKMGYMTNRFKKSARSTLAVIAAVFTGLAIFRAKSSSEQELLSATQTVAFSPDGVAIASGHANGEVKLWEPTSNQFLRVIVKHKDGVSFLAFASRAKVLASSNYNEIKLTNIEKGDLIRLFKQTTASIAVSPDGGTLAGGSLGWDVDPFNLSVRVWDIKTGRLRLTLKGHHNTVGSVAYSSDGKELVSADEGGTVKLWNVRTGALLLTLPNSRPYKRARAMFVSEGKLLATITDNLRERGYATGGAPNFQFVQTRPIDKTIEVWDVRAKKLLHTLDAHEKGVRCMAISQDGKLLASGSYQDPVKLWDIATGELSQTLDASVDGAISLDFSPDGKQLAGAIQHTGKIKLWSIE